MTPGHLFLNENRGFERIDSIVTCGGKIIRVDGKIEPVDAEKVARSEATDHLYESVEEFDTASFGNKHFSQEQGVAGELRVYSRKPISSEPSCHELDHCGVHEGEACC